MAIMKQLATVLTGIVFGLIGAVMPASAQAQRPNILVIWTSEPQQLTINLDDSENGRRSVERGLWGHQQHRNLASITREFSVESVGIVERKVYDKYSPG
jgi:hypothetical protein